MGQINLFASTLTDSVRDFINQYQDGLLWKVSLSRVLDERDFPHAWAYENKVEHNFILMEVSEPLIQEDINWLYCCIIDNKWEFTRQRAMAYAIERMLNPTPQELKEHPHLKRAIRRDPKNDVEWDRIRNFRRLLEAPAIAFRHFKKTYVEGGFLEVHRHDPILMIEYDGIDVPFRPGKDRD